MSLFSTDSEWRSILAHVNDAASGLQSGIFLDLRGLDAFLDLINLLGAPFAASQCGCSLLVSLNVPFFEQKVALSVAIPHSAQQRCPSGNKWRDVSSISVIALSSFCWKDGAEFGDRPRGSSWCGHGRPPPLPVLQTQPLDSMAHSDLSGTVHEATIPRMVPLRS